MDYTAGAKALSEAYASMYDEGYKTRPKAKMQDEAAMKPDTAKGESQARKMDTVRKATKEFPKEVKSAVKGQEMSNRKSGLEKLIKKTPSHKNKAYELEGQKHKDLNKRYGPKKEEVEAVFSFLIGEGIAHNEESAINILTHMSDEWYDSIVESFISEA